MSVTPTPRRHGVASNVARGCLGNLVEWFDWFVYATFSIYFAASFFPKGIRRRSCCRRRWCSPSAS